MSDYASDEVETLREALDAALAEIERLQLYKQLANEYGLSIFEDLESLTRHRNALQAAVEMLQVLLSRWRGCYEDDMRPDGDMIDETDAILNPQALEAK